MSEVLKACGHNPDLCLTVTGFGDAGAALVASPSVDKIIFTGSPEVFVVGVPSSRLLVYPRFAFWRTFFSLSGVQMVRVGELLQHQSGQGATAHT